MSTSFSHLAATQPVVLVHAVSMLGAVALGGWLLLGRKGAAAHRVGGWAWVALMATAVLTSLFIRSDFVNLGGFGPIHLLTLLVMVTLPLGVLRARQHRVQAHRQVMRQIYFGACLVAGAFTLLPGRFLGQLLWA